MVIVLCWHLGIWVCDDFRCKCWFLGLSLLDGCFVLHFFLSSVTSECELYVACFTVLCDWYDCGEYLLVLEARGRGHHGVMVCGIPVGVGGQGAFLFK